MTLNIHSLSLAINYIGKAIYILNGDARYNPITENLNKEVEKLQIELDEWVDIANSVEIPEIE